MLGFGMWEDSVDLTTLHIKKAKQENLDVMHNDLEVLFVDDHKIHIDEHIAFLIGGEIKKLKNTCNEALKYVKIIKRCYYEMYVLWLC